MNIRRLMAAGEASQQAIDEAAAETEPPLPIAVVVDERSPYGWQSSLRMRSTDVGVEDDLSQPDSYGR